MKRLLFLLFLFFFNSCSKECKLTPIPENVFELNKIKERNILNYGDEIDSIIFVDEYDIYTDKSYKGLMKYEECGHSKSYSVEFRNEPIQICLNKTEKKGLELCLYGWFNNSSNDKYIILSEKKLSENREYTFYRNTNSDSLKCQIKELTLKGYKIESITTLDNKKWVLK